MKKLTLFFLTLTLFTLAASAANLTLSFTSQGVGTNTPENGTITASVNGGAPQDVFNIVPHYAWGGIPDARWVSPYDSGGQVGAVVVPNGTLYDFVHTFYVDPNEYNTVVSARIRALTDDRGTIWINGVQVASSGYSQINYCVDNPPPSCTMPTLLDVNINPSLLVLGVNTFRFETEQLYGGPSGADYRMDVQVQTPEPGTLSLLVAGGVLVLIRRRYHLRR